VARTRPNPGCKKWKRLREPQHRLYVSELSEYTVLVDRFADELSEWALRVLSDGERVVRSFALCDLLTGDEIAEQRELTSAPDWWLRGMLIDIGVDGQTLNIQTWRGTMLRIDMSTGALEKLE
jgi:hypothetical protein